MNKKDCIIPYYQGNQEFAIFLLNTIYQTNELIPDILTKENINAAKMGCISNILLGIKEDLVEQEKEQFKSKILLSELENVVETIATKTENGYMLHNTLFEDPALLVAEVRNKIAHGNFTLDLSHNRVILKKDGKEIIININKLELFIVTALKNYKMKKTDTTYERDIAMSPKIDASRKNKITSDEELIKTIKRFNVIKFILKCKTDGQINPVVQEEMDKIIRIYKKTQNNKMLYELKALLKPHYEFRWEITKIKKYSDVKEIVTRLNNIMPENIEYSSQIRNIGIQIQRQLDDNYETFSPIAANLKNLILLDEMYRENTLNLCKIAKDINKVYENFEIDYDLLAASSIAMFNSLFSYANDDIFQTEEFDYENLDLSLLNVEILKIDKPELEEINLKIAKEEKEQIELNNLLTKTNENLNKIDKSNTKGVTNLTNKLNELKTKELKTKQNIKVLEQEKENIEKEYEEKEERIKNSFIIERLRNSIAHGNYKVKINESYEEAELEFKDEYKGELKLKASIKLVDFVSLIARNKENIEEFVSEKQESKTR